MADWRERGYVPDSDDEEDDQDRDSQCNNNHGNLTSEATPAHVPSPSLFANAIEDDVLDKSTQKESEHGEDSHYQLEQSDSVFESTAARLEAEILKGLKTVHDVLGDLPSLLDSDDDSPLSSAPSSPRTTPRPSPVTRKNQDSLGVPHLAVSNETFGSPSSVRSSADNGIQRSRPNEVRPTIAVEIPVSPLPTDDSLSLSAVHDALRRRSFRPRAPIQLHPYALEDATYRQAWTARGLKPVRAPEILPNPEKTTNEESQDTTAYESSQVDAADVPVRSSTLAVDPRSRGYDGGGNDEPRSPSRDPRPRQSSPYSDLDDDLPDLSEMIKRRAAKATKPKLRKPARASLNEPRMGEGGFQIYDFPDDDPIVQHPSRTQRLTSVTPLSPPRSRGGLSSQDGITVHIPDVQMGNSTPTLLPTPVMSSDKPASKRNFAALFDVADSESDVGDVASHSSASSSKESANDESQGVQRMRRKIKGVLPASWLKLDMKQRDNPARAARHQAQSPVKKNLEKGIAKPVPSSARQTGDRLARRMIEEDVGDVDTSSESGSELRVMDQMDDVQYDLPDIIEDDMMEDNTIDAMLAPRVRKPPTRKRQQRLSGVWSKRRTEKSGRSLGRKPPSSHRGSNVKVDLKSHKPPLPRKRVKRKQGRREVTILDAPGFEEKDVPRFLKIASRRTGDTSTARKQDISTKFFRLATTKDTLDVHDGLRRWKGNQGRQGSTIKSNDGPRRITTSSAPRTHVANSIANGTPATSAHNDQSRLNNLNDFDRQVISLKQTTKATLGRIRAQQHETRSLLGTVYTASAAAALPSVVLDYFHPGTSRRDVHNLAPPRSNEPSSGEPREPLLKLGRSFVVQRRIPQPANARREKGTGAASHIPATRGEAHPRALHPVSSGWTEGCSNPTAGNDNAHSTGSRATLLPQRHAPRRPPKKRQPIDRRISKDDYFDLRDLWAFESLSIGSDKDIIANAITLPPNGRSLPKTGVTPGAQPDHLDLISVTLSSMAGTARFFESRWLASTIRTPKTQRTLSATGWTPAVEAILRDALTETFEITCKGIATSPFAGGERTALLSKAADSVETIIGYVNQSLGFPNQQELEAFLEWISNFLETIWRGIAQCEAATREPHASSILRILNRLLILGYQVDQCATVLTSPGMVQSKISEITGNLARLAWEIALRKEHIGVLFAYIAAPSDIGPGSDAPRYRYAAEVETIVLIHIFGPHRGWNFWMQNILFIEDNTDESYLLKSRAEALAYTVLLLGCILPVSGSEGISSPQGTHSSNSLGLSLRGMLVSRVSEFLKSYLEHKLKYGKRFTNTSVHVRKLEKFGLVMFQWCLLLTRNFLHDLADDLLKAMFKYYSELGMVELFGQRVQANMDQMPQFLKDQVPAKGLIPEDDDSDFHVFLKLAAITLTVRPPAQDTTAEQMRKLDLRKRSVLFLLLPNRGRDLAVDDLSLFEEDKDLTLTNFTGIANRYSLFATLYRYAPIGFKPVLAQITNYIDFPTAHDQVRRVILECWTNIVKSILSQPTNDPGLQELGQWIQEMFSSVCSKLASIPTDNNSMHPEEVVRAQHHVHRINRKTTVNCLQDIVAKYAAALDLCANGDQVSYLLTREEVRALIMRCYVNQGLGDTVVSQVFGLLTSYIKKGLNREREAMLLFRRDLRGLLEDQLLRNKVESGLEYELLLVSMTEAWYALGKIMVTGGAAHWDQFLDHRSHMSFPQIANVESGRLCQVLLMSKIAEERDVVLTNPYPFIELVLHSILKPPSNGSRTTFSHRLLNQLMESIPDAFSLATLRRNLSNGVNPFFLDSFDIINHRLTILDHFMRYAYVLRAASDGPYVADLNDGQWNDLMTLICTSLRRTANELQSEAKSDWMTFAQKVLFRLRLYRGPGNGSDSWLLDVRGEDADSNVFRLERLFVRLPGNNDSVHLDNESAAKVFRSIFETAYLKIQEEKVVKHLVNFFAAADPDYIDDDGSVLLDVSQQVDFMKAILPAYIEAALDSDRPSMMFAIPVLDVAIGVLKKLELRVDLEDQAHMESFAELIAILMGAVVKDMQQSLTTPVTADGWQMKTVRRLVDLCAVCGGRWAHIHQLFPTSTRVLAVQPLVQAYACYTLEYACVMGGHEMSVRHSNPLFRTDGDIIQRWQDDFGFKIDEVTMPEHIRTLKNTVAHDLRLTERDWHKVGFTTYGPVWELRRGGSPAMARVDLDVVRDGNSTITLQQVVARLEESLVLLGVVVEVL